MQLTSLFTKDFPKLSQNEVFVRFPGVQVKREGGAAAKVGVV